MAQHQGSISAFVRHIGASERAEVDFISTRRGPEYWIHDSTLDVLQVDADVFGSGLPSQVAAARSSARESSSPIRATLTAAT